MHNAQRWTALLVFSTALTATPALPAEDAGLSAPARAAVAQVGAIDQEIEDWSMQLWEFSEIALEEHRSAAYLADRLEREGFRVARGVAGMPTAFIAEWGQGKPVIGFTAEYDALPSIGNDPVPKRQQRGDGHPHGHGCGHNLFGAGATGAAIALSRAMQEAGIGGTLRVYGSPAEETLVGKVYMAKAGLFDDLDAALDWHPLDSTSVNNSTGQAMNNFAVEFFGKSSHGAYDPWNGRSALDAVEIMSVAVNMMREHIRPSARIHSVVTHGGEAPNVVPAYARAWYYVRDSDRKLVDENYQWLLEIAAAAAQATQTTHKVSLVTGVHELLLNRPLQELMQDNLEAIGGPRLQRVGAGIRPGVAGLPRAGAARPGHRGEEPLANEPDPVEGGSTDVAEISWDCAYRVPVRDLRRLDNCPGTAGQLQPATGPPGRRKGGPDRRPGCWPRPAWTCSPGPNCSRPPGRISSTAPAEPPTAHRFPWIRRHPCPPQTATAIGRPRPPTWVRRNWPPW